MQSGSKPTEHTVLTWLVDDHLGYCHGLGELKIATQRGNDRAPTLRSLDHRRILVGVVPELLELRIPLMLDLVRNGLIGLSDGRLEPLDDLFNLGRDALTSIFEGRDDVVGGLATKIGDLAAGLFGDRRHVADGFVEGAGALLKRLFGGLMGGRAGFLVLAGHNLSVSLLGSYSSCS